MFWLGPKGWPSFAILILSDTVSVDGCAQFGVSFSHIFQLSFIQVICLGVKIRLCFWKMSGLVPRQMRNLSCKCTMWKHIICPFFIIYFWTHSTQVLNEWLKVELSQCYFVSFAAYRTCKYFIYFNYPAKCHILVFNCTHTCIFL